MASWSSSHASGSGISADSAQSMNAGGLDATFLGEDEPNQRNDGSATSASGASGAASFDEFFNFGSMNGFEFGNEFGGPTNADPYSLDPFCFEQHDFGAPFGSIVGAEPSDTTPFLQLDFPNFNTSMPGYGSSLFDQPLNHNPACVTGPNISTHGTDLPQSGELRHRYAEQQPNSDPGCAALDPAQPVPYPGLLAPHLDPEVTTSPSAFDSVQEPPRVETPNASTIPINNSNARAGSAHPHRTRSRQAHSPYPDASQTKKAKERTSKAKSKAEKNVWRVITAPTPQTTQTDSQSASGGGSTPSEASSSTGNSKNGTTKRPGRRKEVFQHVEPPKLEKQGRPEWYVSPQPWKHDLTLPPQRNPLPPGTHSDLGWVMARLREPDCERPTYGWAVAQIHSPYNNTYLILSGPHQTKVKMVREYDRIAYSPENIAKLQEQVQKRRSGSRVEKVYDKITVDTATITRLSSVFGTMQAAGSSIWVPD